MQGLFQAIFYTEKVNALFTNEASIAYMLQFESALATAQAKHGVIPQDAAEIIADSCNVEGISITQLITDAGLGGNVNIPLVKQLTRVVRQKDIAASKFVHFGATSQDVIDTALMQQLRDAIKFIDADLNQLIKQLISLVAEHRNTLMVGRSFMQHARPITFGYKAADWLHALLRSKEAIDNLLKNHFLLQLGGAIGTLYGMHEKGLQVAETMSELLDLKNPVKPWHTEGDRFAAIATTLGILTGNVAKMAKDISLLMQTEIAEVFEPSAKGKGGSSTMPHKRNPVACIAILANHARVPSLVATIISCMAQDHERATGLWHATWETIADITKLTAGAVKKAVELTDGLDVDKEQMLLNLEKTNGLIYAENLSLALADKIGKEAAHELVEACCKEAQTTQIHLKEIALNNNIIRQHLGDRIQELFDPVHSTGFCEKFITGVLEAV